MLKYVITIMASIVILTGCVTQSEGTASVQTEQIQEADQEDSVESVPQDVMISEKDSFEDPEIQYEKGQKLQSSNPVAALAWYCYAARQGHGSAQSQAGQMLANGGAGLASLIAGEKEDLYRSRMRAAAMMWLDMAIINQDKNARPARKELGKKAISEDFELYSRYTRMQIDAPCTMTEIMAVAN